MLAWTASSAASDEKWAVMTPSNQLPCAPLLPSPPVPRPMAPSLRIGLYRVVGRCPSNTGFNGPDWALPFLIAHRFAPAAPPLTMPTTYLCVTGLLGSYGLVLPAHRPSSRSPMIHGPAPSPLPQITQVPK